MFTAFPRIAVLPRWPALFLERFRGIRSAPATLDVKSLPEHLKRDLGLAGGRSSAPRDPLRD
jgi:hypothetical protein